MLIYGWVVCSLAALFYCYEYLLRIEPSVMVRDLMRNFSITATGVGFLSAMYYYAYAPLQAVVGITTDYYGPRRVLSVAILSCAVGSFLLGISHLLLLAELGRLLIGIGSAFAFVGVLKLAAMWLPHRHFALFAGITTSLGMLGAMFGDIELSYLTGQFGWRGIVLYSALAGAALAPIFFLVVRDREENLKKSARQGMVFFLKEFGGFLINPSVLIAGVVGCCLYLSLSAFGEIWGVLFIRKITHLDKVDAATLNSMVFFGWLVGGPLQGFISDRIKSRRLPLIFGSILAAVTFSIILIHPHMPHVVLGLLLFLFGFFCSVEIMCFAIARDISGVQKTAIATGVVNMLIMFGGMIFQPLIGHILDIFWQGKVLDGVRVYSLVTYRYALIVIPIALVLSTILSAILPRIYNVGEKKAP